MKTPKVIRKAHKKVVSAVRKKHGEKAAEKEKKFKKIQHKVYGEPSLKRKHAQGSLKEARIIKKSNPKRLEKFESGFGL